MNDDTSPLETLHGQLVVMVSHLLARRQSSAAAAASSDRRHSSHDHKLCEEGEADDSPAVYRFALPAFVWAVHGIPMQRNYCVAMVGPIVAGKTLLLERLHHIFCTSLQPNWKDQLPPLPPGRGPVPFPIALSSTAMQIGRRLGLQTDKPEHQEEVPLLGSRACEMTPLLFSEKGRGAVTVETSKKKSNSDNDGSSSSSIVPPLESVRASTKNTCLVIATPSDHVHEIAKGLMQAGYLMLVVSAVPDECPVEVPNTDNDKRARRTSKFICQLLVLAHSLSVRGVLVVVNKLDRVPEQNREARFTAIENHVRRLVQYTAKRIRTTVQDEGGSTSTTSSSSSSSLAKNKSNNSSQSQHELTLLNHGRAVPVSALRDWNISRRPPSLLLALGGSNGEEEEEEANCFTSISSSLGQKRTSWYDGPCLLEVLAGLSGNMMRQSNERKYYHNVSVRGEGVLSSTTTDTIQQAKEKFTTGLCHKGMVRCIIPMSVYKVAGVGTIVCGRVVGGSIFCREKLLVKDKDDQYQDQKWHVVRIRSMELFNLSVSEAHEGDVVGVNIDPPLRPNAIDASMPILVDTRRQQQGLQVESSRPTAAENFFFYNLRCPDSTAKRPTDPREPTRFLAKVSLFFVPRDTYGPWGEDGPVERWNEDAKSYTPPRPWALFVGSEPLCVFGCGRRTTCVVTKIVRPTDRGSDSDPKNEQPEEAVRAKTTPTDSNSKKEHPEVTKTSQKSKRLTEAEQQAMRDALKRRLNGQSRSQRCKFGKRLTRSTDKRSVRDRRRREEKWRNGDVISCSSAARLTTSKQQQSASASATTETAETTWNNQGGEEEKEKAKKKLSSSPPSSVAVVEFTHSYRVRAQKHSSKTKHDGDEDCCGVRGCGFLTTAEESDTFSRFAIVVSGTVVGTGVVREILD